MEAGGSECQEHILERRPSERQDAYRDISGTTPGMGEVELSLERKSRATQEHLPGCKWLKTSGTSFTAKAEYVLESTKNNSQTTVFTR